MTFSEFCKSEFGYETRTTFWEDFSIADAFGEEAIRDTYRRAFGEWKTDVEYLTELVLVLNHKIWQHFRRGNHAVAKVYDELWREAHSWAGENLSAEDYAYYYKVLD